jgi:hypothetical protein
MTGTPKIQSTGQSYLRFYRRKQEHSRKKRDRKGREFKSILDGAMGVDLRV